MTWEVKPRVHTDPCAVCNAPIAVGSACRAMPSGDHDRCAHPACYDPPPTRIDPDLLREFLDAGGITSEGARTEVYAGVDIHQPESP